MWSALEMTNDGGREADPNCLSDVAQVLKTDPRLAAVL